MILVVDDLRLFPFSHCVYARTSLEALDILHSLRSLDSLYLDHDLGGDDTTLPVVDYLRERAHYDDKLSIGRVVVHSDNPPGSETIVRSLSRIYICTRVDARLLGATVS